MVDADGVCFTWLVFERRRDARGKKVRGGKEGAGEKKAGGRGGPRDFARGIDSTTAIGADANPGGVTEGHHK